MKIKSFKSLGFTLLELLIAISIIGILIAVLAVSYSTVQKRGRDGRRRSDIKALSSALEQYYANNDSVYPVEVSACSGLTSDLDTNYLPGGVPTDPKGTGIYAYSCSATGTDYCICAHLESAGQGNASDANCSFGSGDYFCLTNLQ